MSDNKNYSHNPHSNEHITLSSGSAPLKIFVYSESNHIELETNDIREALSHRSSEKVTWINIESIENKNFIETIGSEAGLHPLTIEDILHTRQRPKFETFENYIYIVLNMLTYNSKSKSVESEQVSIIVFNDMILSFLEDAGDVFEPVRDKIRSGKGRIRKQGADYLAYCLLDMVIDQYFIVLEDLGECIEELQDELIEDPTPETMQTIHQLKREMILLRRSIWPLRDVVSGLERDESGFFGDVTRIYLRDIYDHSIQAVETIETYRDIFSGMLDIYLTSLNNKMNSIMKVLTIIATIFIPLTFIASIYGMNFRHMPELESPYGYPIVVAVMCLVSVAMIVFFKKKKWW